MSVSNKTAQHKKATLKALEKSLGIVTLACKNVGIGRSQFYLWVREDQEFSDAVDELEGVAIDFVESSLHKQIKNGNSSSTIFYLKTKGRKRGYVEKMENINKNENTEVKIINLGSGIKPPEAD